MKVSAIFTAATATVFAANASLAFQPCFYAASSRCSTTPTSAPLSATAVVSSASSADAPLLRRNPPRKVCLMVEPTPFTHVSGYANRFKEMLKFMKKAGDEVDILTVDSKTPAKDLPSEYQNFSITHTQGLPSRCTIIYP